VLTQRGVVLCYGRKREKAKKKSLRRGACKETCSEKLGGSGKPRRPKFFASTQEVHGLSQNKEFRTLEGGVKDMCQVKKKSVA